MTIPSRWQKISKSIENLSQSTPVTPIAVSKYHSLDSMQQAYGAGARHFAESYLQEALPKIAALQNISDITWHFIGPIQSNKTANIAKFFQWVQSVSRVKIAQRLNDQRPAALTPLNVLIQINISADTNKSGLQPAAVETLAILIENLPRLCLRGIMCIPENKNKPKDLVADFKKMMQIYKFLQCHFSHIDTLSMGMSNDYQIAIANGANMVRIGTALFGSRK